MWGVQVLATVWPPPFILKLFLVSHKWKSPVPGWLCAFHQWARFITPSSDLYSDLPLAAKIWLHLHQGRKNSVWHVKLWLTQPEPIADLMAHWNSLAWWYHKTMDVFSLTCPQRSPQCWTGQCPLLWKPCWHAHWVLLLLSSPHLSLVPPWLLPNFPRELFPLACFFRSRSPCLRAPGCCRDHADSSCSLRSLRPAASFLFTAARGCSAGSVLSPASSWNYWCGAGEAVGCCERCALPKWLRARDNPARWCPQSSSSQNYLWTRFFSLLALSTALRRPFAASRWRLPDMWIFYCLSSDFLRRLPPNLPWDAQSSLLQMK